MLRSRLKYGVLILFFLLIVVLGWSYTWDDSAITMAFSKNFAQHGEIKPSVYSDRVEGYSTFLWMVLLSWFFRSGCSPDTVLSLAKSITLLISLLNFYLFYRILSAEFKNDHLTFAGLFLFIFSGIIPVEALDGMETPLYLLLLLLSFTGYLKKRVSPRYRDLYLVCSSMLILVRFEAAFFLLPFLIMDCKDEKWRIFRQPGLYIWVAVFVGYQIWHYSYFGTILPNTVLAKRQTMVFPNSRDVAGAVVFHLRPILRFFFTYSSVLLWVTLTTLRHKKRHNRYPSSLSRTSILAFFLFLFGVFFNVVIGDNSGPINRMFYPFIPFFLILSLALIAQTESRLLFSPKILTVVLVFLFLALHIRMFAFQVKDNITVANYRRVALAVDKVRLATGKGRMVFAGPDMGGLLLYSRHLRVIDVAMLCNRYLALHGYNVFEDYIFFREKPDLLEIHTNWTEMSGIHEMDVFYRQYRPLYVDGMRFFIRCELLSELVQDDLVYESPVPPLPKSGKIWPGDRKIDDTFKGCFIFDPPLSSS